MDYIGQIIEGLKYAFPAAVTGYTAYYFLQSFYKNEEKKQLILAKRDLLKQALPIRLQAYERLSLLLERVSPAKLVQMIQPGSEDKRLYELALISQINTEFEHNLTQQIYVTGKCWEVILTTKNATMLFIRQIVEDANIITAQDLQRALVEKSANEEVPTNVGLAFIRGEVDELLK